MQDFLQARCLYCHATISLIAPKELIIIIIIIIIITATTTTIIFIQQ